MIWAERVYGVTKEPIATEDEANERSNQAVDLLDEAVGLLGEIVAEEALILEFAMKDDQVDREKYAHVIAGASAVTETVSLCQTMLQAVLNRMQASYNLASREDKGGTNEV